MMTQLSQPNQAAPNDLFYEEEEETQETVSDSRKYLTFVSNGLGFAIPSDYVIEIINEHNITHLPRVPGYIKGIINLRGQIIPIMDARLRMGHPESAHTKETCIIVISVNENSIGLFVDKVLHMIDIPDDAISEPPVNNNQEFVNGITHLNNVVYLLLDCELLLK
ncbi:MAG: chemotaxis protein CheW [Clostridiales bacterium]|nr:chemotaxis protein CheW [Clostridiales bacterium]